MTVQAQEELQSQKRSEEEVEVTQDAGAEEQALQAAQQYAFGSEAIPAVTTGAEDLVTQAAGERAQSASEQALGTGGAPILGLFKSQKAKQGTTEQQGAPQTATTQADKPTQEKQAVGPWTAQTIAKLVAEKSAGGVLQAVNARDSKNGVTLLKGSGAWDKILQGLPKGDALAAGTKVALYELIVKQAVTMDDAKRMFSIRFNHPLTETSGTWTFTNLRIVWQQLDTLPETDVSENTILTAFIAIAGGGGFGPSWEAPKTINTIQLGESSGASHLPHTVRHEVGHGVHAQIPSPINSWLQSNMSFWFSGTDDSGLDSWIGGLGGYPDKYTGPDGKEHAFDGTAKQWIRHMVKQFTGRGSWSPGRTSPEQTEGTWQRAMWAAMPQAVKSACAQSTSHWYNNWRNFQKGSDGKRYFLNHWYHRPFTIGDVAAQAIEATGDDYTAMSEKEFFANCYAEYFKDPEGVKDQTKWGGGLPSPIQDFFKICVVQRHPYDKFTQSQKRKET
jgi:hypothetical protein